MVFASSLYSSPSVLSSSKHLDFVFWQLPGFL